MKRTSRTTTDNEPVGIVIANGGRADRAPVVWAYVWGPAPEAPTDSDADK